MKKETVALSMILLATQALGATVKSTSDIGYRFTCSPLYDQADTHKTPIANSPSYIVDTLNTEAVYLNDLGVARRKVEIGVAVVQRTGHGTVQEVIQLHLSPAFSLRVGIYTNQLYRFMSSTDGQALPAGSLQITAGNGQVQAADCVAESPSDYTSGTSTSTLAN